MIRLIGFSRTTNGSILMRRRIGLRNASIAVDTAGKGDGICSKDWSWLVRMQITARPWRLSRYEESFSSFGGFMRVARNQLRTLWMKQHLEVIYRFYAGCMSSEKKVAQRLQ